MSINAQLSDSQCNNICSFLHTHPRASVGDEAYCRRFVEGGYTGFMRTRAQWRFLPYDDEPWTRVFKQ